MSSTTDEEISDRVLTIPNVITLVRLLLVPLFIWLLFFQHADLLALAVYIIASCTDWIDGQIARRFNQVSRIGKMFDPLVDRILLATGVISVCVLGRIPLWIVILLVARDALLLLEGRAMLSAIGKVPPVIYIGKFATAFLMVGFCLLILGAPTVPGFGIESIGMFLPGIGTSEALLGIYFVYAGMICSIIAFIIYQIKGSMLFFSEQHRHKVS